MTRLIDQSSSSLIGGAVVFCILATLPQILDTSFLALAVRILVFALFATSVNLLFGYTGLLTFGHAAYYGVGAYSIAIILAKSVLPSTGLVTGFIPALLVAIVVAGIVAAGFGIVIVTRGGFYFAMLTLAFSMLVYTLARQWSGLTGGPDGMILPASTVNLWLVSFSTSDLTQYYYLALAILLLSFLAIWRVVNSQLGELLRATRENPNRAEFVGLPVYRIKLLAFTISGVFSGLAGALIVPVNVIATPDLIYWAASGDPLIAILLGGMNNFLGPAIGATVFILLEHGLQNVISEEGVPIGVIMVLVVLYMPNGILGQYTGIQDLRNRVSAFLERK